MSSTLGSDPMSSPRLDGARDADVIARGRRYILGRSGDRICLWDKKLPDEPFATFEGSLEANARLEFERLERHAREGRRRFRRRALLVAIPIICAAGVVAYVVASDAASSPSDEVASASTSARYVNTVGGYTFRYPGGWNLTPSSATTQVSSPDGLVSVSLQVAPAGDLSAVSGSFAHTYASSWTEVAYEPPQLRTLGSAPAAFLGGTATDAGRQVRFLTIVVREGARNYALAVTVPREWDPAALMPSIDTIVTSFAPITPAASPA